ncbi:MAG: aldehyde dehydrogenase family protein [Clostridia bacterium]|nr:aldehyde dehydrogenase family protein [Clostridia bacterium]
MEWTREHIHGTVEQQREYFRSGKTLPVSRRIEMLKKLRSAVEEHRTELEDALRQDLGRHSTEAFFCDIGSTIMEINEIIRGLKKWAKPERHFSGLHCFPSLVTRVYKMPYGVTLIISPFNFPILLSLGVLAASISGGNTAVLKVSSKSKACSGMLQRLIADTFPEEYVTVVDGGHDIADLCLEERFDKIFYTGSPRVAVHVLEMAAKHLTPAALELGGETGNWCVIRKDADLKDAARKVAFFKMLNSGQICININQVAVAEEAVDEFIRELKAAFAGQIGEDAVANPEYPKLISEKAYETCAKEAEQYRERIVYGGYGDPETRRYAPTVIYPVQPDEPIVRHELFNPLLPVVPFRDEEADELMELIAKREHGLALYLFTRNKKWARKVMSSQQYGGGCINEVCLHMMVRGVPFNGTGHSGMGAYHGKWGFREFTHPSTVLTGSTRLNLPLREHPYARHEGIKRHMLQAFEK